MFNTEQKTQLTEAVCQAEMQTSGEIRLFIEQSCKGDVLDRAAFIFQQLKMHKTELRNGVLFYLALKDKKFSILGDSGINAVVGSDFWEEIKNTMLQHFKNGDFQKGLSCGITMAGTALKKYFPRQKNDKNELPDEIVFG